MEPAAEVLRAAERVRQSLESSTVWAPALTGARVRPAAARVLPLRERDIPYFLVDIVRNESVTARFVLDDSGTLLEAECAARADGVLPLWATPPSAERGSPPEASQIRLIWKPCDQSTSRLRPFWEVTGTTGVRYVRVDGASFDRLTITGWG